MPISTSSSAAIEGLLRLLRLEGEELRQADRDAVENALQRADRRIGLVGLDQRDRRVGDACALGKLALGQIVQYPQIAQPSAKIEFHISTMSECFSCSK